MKKIHIIKVIAITFKITISASIKDLDTLPLNENDFTSEKAYGTPESYRQGLAKIYGGFCLIGQGEGDSPGAAENDLPGGGASELNRAWWSLQELSTDAGKVAWVNDGWTAEINNNTWTTINNTNIYAIYNRTTLIVALVNEYLRQTTDEKLEARGTDMTLKALIQKYRAEARLIRAYAYWMAMDVFGNMPFFTENDPVGSFYPPEKSRQELFVWIESELMSLINDANLADARTNTYPRVDKGVAWGLLARMYLNAVVYTGTPRWADAKDAATRVLGAGYDLATNYAELFMGDNGENSDVRKELIYAVAYDKDLIRSDGGTSFLINAALSGNDADAADLTGSATWGGIRTTYQYAQKFNVTAPNYATGTFNCNDKRAMFYIKGRQETMENVGDFNQGWSYIKYSKHSSDGTKNMTNYSSADYPMMRLAEIYFIYAEATLRIEGGATSTDATSLGYLNALRARAFQTAQPSLPNYDLNYILEERARELMWEGHRRTDLIRYGLYTSGSYLWPWKGGVIQGQPLNDCYNLCPLPIEDIRLNKNLTPTPGYIY
jgi:hypothetical protein